MLQLVAEDRLEASDRLRVLDDALAQLSTDDQQLLRLTLVDGMKPGEIAEQLTNLGDYGKVTEYVVKRTLRVEMEKLAEENRQDLVHLRALDLHRIDQALKVLWPKVRDGNLKAMREWRAFIDQRARLLGTYAVTKHEVHGVVEHMLDPSARDEIARLEAAFLAAGSFDGEAEELVMDAADVTWTEATGPAATALPPGE